MRSASASASATSAAAIQAAGARGTEEYGGDYPAIVPLMPTGVGTSCPHITWLDEPFAADAGTSIEIAGVRRRYHVPMTRTVYLGTPPEEDARRGRGRRRRHRRGLAAAKPGALARDIHAAWTRTIERHGLFKDSRCGYSVGLNYPPDWGERTISLRSIDETVLQPNMTIHFMPGIWLDDWGIAISEAIRITETGVETFCEFSAQALREVSEPRAHEFHQRQHHRRGAGDHGAHRRRERGRASPTATTTTRKRSASSSTRPSKQTSA